MAFKMKNPSLMKMAKQAGSAMKANGDDKDKKDDKIKIITTKYKDGFGNTLQDRFKKKKEEKKKGKRVKITDIPEIIDYKGGRIIPAKK